MIQQNIKFPADFLWGSATSSYQIEGAAFEDGKGESIWDKFSHTPGKTYKGDTGDIACDHYHRYQEDVKLMADIGLQAYRFSISWPRIFPDGTGNLNQKGLDFYNKLVDELLENNIKPFLTLYHWDMPQALEDKGGWLNKDTPKYFSDYTLTLVRALSDRVKNWFTLNETLYIILLGHIEGVHAPGRKENKKNINQIRHNLLFAHGLAINQIKSFDNNLKAGIAHNANIYIPENKQSNEIEFIKKAFHKENGVLFDPIFKGKYTEKFLQESGKDMPQFSDEEMKIISTPTDFLGLNAYSGTVIRSINNGNDFETVPYPEDYPKTNMGWPINPDCLYWGLKIINELYDMPEYYITENGASFNDTIADDGKVHDKSRIDFYKKYLTSLHKVIKEGVNVKAYFAWTLMDNFEWGEGFKEKFGLIYIDHNNHQKRILKDSAYWYKKVIKDNGFEVTQAV